MFVQALGAVVAVALETECTAKAGMAAAVVATVATYNVATQSVLTTTVPLATATRRTPTFEFACQAPRELQVNVVCMSLISELWSFGPAWGRIFADEMLRLQRAAVAGDWGALAHFARRLERAVPRAEIAA